jgi:hypothetical protein
MRGSNEIIIHGSRYVSAARAAKEFGFVRDHIARLCRQGVVRGQQINSAWYVDLQSLQHFVDERKKRQQLRNEELRRAFRAVPELADQNNVSTPASHALTLPPPEFLAPARTTRPANRRASFIKYGVLSLLLVLIVGATLTSPLASVVGSAQRNLAASIAQVQSPFFGGYPNSLSTSNPDNAAPNFLSSIFASLFGLHPSTQPASQTTSAPPQAPSQNLTGLAFSPAETASQSATSSKQPIIQNITNPVIERTIVQTGVAGVTQIDLTTQLDELSNSLKQIIYSNESAPNSLPASGGFTNEIALSNVIDQLTGTTLNNVTVNGVSGLTAAEIPTNITASNYLPLLGGTLTGALIDSSAASSTFAGALGIGTTSPAQALSVIGRIYTTGGIQFPDGSLQTAAAAAASVGTQGQLAYYANTGLTISGTSTIFLGQSGNVGIGTTTPGSILSLGNVANFTSATSTFYGNGINLSGGCFAIGGVCVSGDGGGGTFTAIGPNGQTQTGPTVTLASSTNTLNGLTSALTITGSGNTLTFAPSLSGTLTVAGGGTGSTTLTGLLKGNGTGSILSAVAGTDYQAPLSFSYPLSNTSNTVSLAFGTTTANTWSNLQTFTGGILTNASSTFGNFTAQNATTTNATTTSLFASTFALSGNYFTSLLGTGLSNQNGVLTVSTSSLGLLGSSSISASAPLGYNAATGIFTISQSGTGANGYLSSTDFTTFENKVSSSSLSGAAIISYNPSTGVITTTGGTFGAGNYTFPGELSVTSSTSLQNFTAINATTTNATSTALFASVASTSNLFASVAHLGATTLSSLTLGSQSGILLSTNGAVSAAATSSLGLLGSSSISASAPLGYNAATGIFTISQSGTGANGYLSSADWTTFNSKISSTSLSGTYPIQYNASTGAFSLAFGTTSANTYSQLQTFNGGASTTNITASGEGYFATASTTNLIVSGLGSGSSPCVTVNAAGLLSTQSCSGAGGTYNFPAPGNATTTSLMILASTTIGNGTQIGGLTISGGATTTGNAYFAGGLGVGVLNTTVNTANLASGGSYQIAGTSVLNGTTLGSGITGSSLTSLGTIASGTWTGTAIAVANGGTGVTSSTGSGNVVLSAGPTLTNVHVGVGTGQQLLYINGGNTGSADGGGIFFQGASGQTAGIGFASTFLGAGYDPSLLLYSPSGLRFYNVGGCTSGVQTSANGTVSCYSSDERLKENIQTLPETSGLAAIDQLNPVSFDWRDPVAKGAGTQLGFIAQQVATIFPDLVTTSTATSTLTPDGTKILNYFGLIPPLVLAVQELDQQLTALAATVAGFAQTITTQVLTAITGNFHQINTDKLCVTKSDGTPVCITGDQLSAVLSGAGQSPSNPVQISGGSFTIASSSPSSNEGTTTSTTTDTSGNTGTSTIITDASSTPPTITINGANPAHIHVGDSYADLGATVSDTGQGQAGDPNLGLKYFLNGTLASSIVIDTSAAATDTIDYVATDTSGLTATSTRTVIIEAAISTDATTSAATSTTQ